jgi:prepilin-type N-terminal cleavage/methylation domain-containing protein
MHISSYKKQADIGGFTLVEVLVSLSLFTVVVTMSVGTLLVLIDANAKQQNIQTVMTNLSFAMDSMTREIRTGYYYQCSANVSGLTEANGANTSDCPGGAPAFAFTESGGSLTGDLDSNRIAYRWGGGEEDPIERRLGNVTSGNGIDWEPITAPEVNIESFEFVVTDTAPYPGNTKSPTVTIFVSGTAGDITGLDTSFAIQTTVTQQILDL